MKQDPRFIAVGSLFTGVFYKLLDFIEVYGTACRIVVKPIYRCLHQRNQFVRNPHGLVAGRFVGLFTRLLCGCYNGSNGDRRVVLQVGIERLDNGIHIYHAGIQRLKQMHSSDVSDTRQGDIAHNLLFKFESCFLIFRNLDSCFSGVKISENQDSKGTQPLCGFRAEPWPSPGRSALVKTTSGCL